MSMNPRQMRAIKTRAVAERLMRDEGFVPEPGVDVLTAIASRAVIWRTRAERIVLMLEKIERDHQ